MVFWQYGPVAELVYAHDLKSCPVRDVGSMPTWPTNKLIYENRGYGLVVECDLPKVETRVRFPLPAPYENQEGKKVGY
jgi:hypothetical protein